MAYLPADDKQQQQAGQNPNPVQQVDTTGAGSVGTPSSGGSDASAGGPPSSYGAGGSGWTNIQSYLGANQGNTGSSQALSNQVGGAFKQDQTNLDSQSQDAQSKGQAQVDNNNVSQDKASQMVQEASKGYNYGGAQSDTYNRNTQALKGNLSAAYQGPTSFNYGLSSASQNYGQGLASDQGFNGVMQSVYDRAGANPMGSGGLALQNQLDSSNGTLTDTRSQLLNQYAGLQGNVANTTAATQAALQGDQAAFTGNQAALKGYLGGQSTANKSAIDSRVADTQSLVGDITNAAHDKDLNFWQAFGDSNGRAFGGSNYSGSPADFNMTTDVSGPSVNESNVNGVDSERNQYNTIADILGAGGAIGKQDPYNLSSQLVHEHHTQSGVNTPGLDSNRSLAQYLTEADAPLPHNPMMGKGPMTRPAPTSQSLGQYYDMAKSLGII